MQTAARKTILILMSDTGGGHRTVVEAIREAVQLLYPERYTVIVEDLFLRSRWPGPRAPKMYLPLITYAPWAWGRSFHWTTGPHGRRVLFGRSPGKIACHPFAHPLGRRPRGTVATRMPCCAGAGP